MTCVEYLLHSVVGSGEIIRGEPHQMVCSSACHMFASSSVAASAMTDIFGQLEWEIACILHHSPWHFWLKSGQSCPKNTTNYNTYGPRLSCEAMPEQVAGLEPIAWLKSADYRGYAGYEQQMALKAHLDSLAVELSLLRSDVVDVLHQRNLRRRRDDIFRLWHFQVAYDKLKQSLEVSSPPPSQNVNVKRARAGVSDRDLRNENTLRCATLLCFFLSSSLLQQIISNWRLVVHRNTRKPLDLRAFPAWRLQLFLWAWRSAVEVKGSTNWRMSLRRRLDEETVFQAAQAVFPRIRKPMIVPKDVIQLLHFKAANALRTLRDNDLAYFILQAWNGAVVSATLAQIGAPSPRAAVVVHQPTPTRPARLWTGRLAGQRLPARPIVFRRSTITMVHILQAMVG